MIGWYKSHEPKTKWMEWLFSSTSQHFPHNLHNSTLDSMIAPPALETTDTPIVTGNRIFVTISVVGFGVSKAIVTYRGFPTSANTLDWVFGVVVSTLSVFFTPFKVRRSYLGRTYCLEMYQDEAAYAWPSVFQTDYQPSVYSGM